MQVKQEYPMLSGKTVFLADDDKYFARGTKSIFQEYSATVITANSPKKILSMLKEPGICDIIILDIMMPGIKDVEYQLVENAIIDDLQAGFNILDVLRTQPEYKHLKNIPILCFSVRNDVVQRVADQEYGLTLGLCKGESVDTVLNTISTLLQQAAKFSGSD